MILENAFHFFTQNATWIGVIVNSILVSILATQAWVQKKTLEMYSLEFKNRHRAILGVSDRIFTQGKKADDRIEINITNYGDLPAEEVVLSASTGNEQASRESFKKIKFDESVKTMIFPKNSIKLAFEFSEHNLPNGETGTVWVKVKIGYSDQSNTKKRKILNCYIKLNVVNTDGSLRYKGYDRPQLWETKEKICI